MYLPTYVDEKAEQEAALYIVAMQLVYRED
jgi:hypothetical protein